MIEILLVEGLEGLLVVRVVGVVEIVQVLMLAAADGIIVAGKQVHGKV